MLVHIVLVSCLCGGISYCSECIVRAIDQLTAAHQERLDEERHS